MKLYEEDGSLPECSVVLAHECSSWVDTSANNASEQNATGGRLCMGLLCQRMLAVFVVLYSENIYGRCIMGYVFIVTTALRLSRL